MKNRLLAVGLAFEEHANDFFIPFGGMSFLILAALYLTSIQIPFLAQKDFLIFFGSGLGTISLICWQIKNKQFKFTGFIKQVAPHFFLSSLLVSIGLSLIQPRALGLDFNVYNLQRILLIISIVSGVLTVYTAEKLEMTPGTLGKKTEAIILTSLFIIFIALQLYKLSSTGIGTDEGNFLYTAKLILSGKHLFIDFYSRESGSLFFLLPWFYFFKTTILNLRLEILLFHVGIFFIVFNTLKLLTNKKINIYIVLLVTEIIFQYVGFFDFFSGSFIQISNLLNLINLNILIRYSKKPNFKLLLLNALILGISILVYKGSQAFLIISLIYLFLNSKKPSIKEIYATLAFSLLPIIIYYLYYSIKTDFFHIYRMLLNDVFINFFVLALLCFAVDLLRKQDRIYNALQKYFFDNTDNLILGSNLIALLSLIYSYVQTPEGYYGFFESLYSGFIISSFLIISIQAINLAVIKKYKKGLALFYFVSNILILINGFGNSGYYLKIDEPIHIAVGILFLIYSLSLLRIPFEYFIVQIENNYSVEKTSTVVSVNIYIFILLIGAFINAYRLQSVSMFFPLLLIFLLEDINYKTIVNYTIYPSLLIFLIINITKENSYTISPYNDFKNTVQYINKLDAKVKLFSFETPILSEVIPQNEFFFSSPFSYIDRFHQLKDFPDYQNEYQNIKNKYPGKGISLTTDEVFSTVNDADYVVTSQAYTEKMLRKYIISKGMTVNLSSVFSTGNWTIYRVEK